MDSPRSGRRARCALRAALGCALCCVAARAQDTGIASERLLAAIRRETPAATRVERGAELARAEAAAAAIPGGEVFWGVGASMAPLYPSRTALVVAPVKFEGLRKGMTVVYVNGRGRRVAHALTGSLPQGWVAQGVANIADDDDLVTPQNLVGVIVQAFAAEPAELRVARTQAAITQDVPPLTRRAAGSSVVMHILPLGGRAVNPP